jgi:hypothetical protein
MLVSVQLLARQFTPHASEPPISSRHFPASWDSSIYDSSLLPGTETVQSRVLICVGKTSIRVATLHEFFYNGAQVAKVENFLVNTEGHSWFART